MTVLVITAAAIFVVLVAFVVPILIESYCERRLDRARDGGGIGNEEEIRQHVDRIQNGNMIIPEVIGADYRMLVLDLWYRVKHLWGRLLDRVVPEYNRHRRVRAEIVQYQRELIRDVETIQERREANAARIAAAQADLVRANESQVKAEEKYALVVHRQIAYENLLERGYEALRAHPPEGFAGVDFEAPKLWFHFEFPNQRLGAVGRVLRQQLAVSVDVTNGHVEGQVNPWQSAIQISALKHLAQGNLTALVTMIARSLAR